MLPTPPPSPTSSALSPPADRIGEVLAGSIQLTGVLGVGAYGTVYQARDVHTGAPYAVKALNKLALTPRQRKFQDREIQLHYAASHHPNVVSLVKILDAADCTYVVLEYCPEGDLFSKITEQGHYVGDDFKAKQVFLHILAAVEHCHASGIYHRDLKPENVLVTDNGWTAKLADFGLATQDPVTSDFGCGSTFYMSPECQQSNAKPYACYASAPNDIWALGVILVNLTCGRNPWKRASTDDSTFRAFMRDRTFLQTILPITEEFNCILQRIFEINPQRRITLGELRERIVRCSRLTTQGYSTATWAPPTPPDSPVEKAAHSSLRVVNGAYEPVPSLDLPAQQYPSLAPRPDFSQLPMLPTPPASGLYTPPPKSVATPLCPGPFLGNLADFRRCGQQMLANLAMPTQWAATF